MEIDGKEQKKTGPERRFTTEPWKAAPGKKYYYEVTAKWEPNNYTTIVRTREVTFKAGEEVTVDLRKKDEKLPDNVIIRWVPTPKLVVKDIESKKK